MWLDSKKKKKKKSVLAEVDVKCLQLELSVWKLLPDLYVEGNCDLDVWGRGRELTV